MVSGPTPRVGGLDCPRRRPVTVWLGQRLTARHQTPPVAVAGVWEASREKCPQAQPHPPLLRTTAGEIQPRVSDPDTTSRVRQESSTVASLNQGLRGL